MKVRWRHMSDGSLLGSDDVYRPLNSLTGRARPADTSKGPDARNFYGLALKYGIPLGHPGVSRVLAHRKTFSELIKSNRVRTVVLINFKARGLL